MSDNVKFIFKTLLKVPCIILVCYLIFNLFAFTFTYFRLLGLSYVVMQTAVENNYIPTGEAEILTRYLDGLETGVVYGLAIGCDTNSSNNDTAGGIKTNIRDDINSENVRVQYGTEMVVTVSGYYNWIFPLVNTADPSKSGNYIGTSNRTTDTPDAQGLEYHETNGDDNPNLKTLINIQYTVPGLKYYPDLA